MFLLYHAYVYLEFLILACTIYILAPPCQVADDSEIGQGSGKKPDNDGVQQALHQHNDQQVTKQGKRPRNIRTLRKGQVSKIKI